MPRVPLRLGPLAADGFAVLRSGVRWLCDDGHVCQAGEVVAYCSIGLKGEGQRLRGGRPFADEERDFQAAIATRIGGRLTRCADASPGGWLDQMHYFDHWAPDFVIGHVECAHDAIPADFDDDVATRLLLLAGRRATGIAEVRSGLLSGWYDRRRAWWGEVGDRFDSLLCLGICDQVGVVQGEERTFRELFDASAGPAHVAYFPDDTVVPCAAVACEQLNRTPEAARVIAADFSHGFGQVKPEPEPRDWLFASAFMAALLRSPLAERHDVLTRAGLATIEAPRAIMTSLNAEGVFVLRHRRLGYAFHCHTFRLVEAGPAFRAWIRAEFEHVRRTPDDIRRDYRALVDAVCARSDTQFLVLNLITTATSENIQSYAGFDRPLGKTLGGVRARELNLMLHDLARERNVSIVDADAIAADLGTLRHAPDGVHGSRLLQDEIRAELLRLLRAHGLAGFGRRAIT